MGGFLPPKSLCQLALEERLRAKGWEGDGGRNYYGCAYYNKQRWQVAICANGLVVFFHYSTRGDRIMMTRNVWGSRYND